MTREPLDTHVQGVTPAQDAQRISDEVMGRDIGTDPFVAAVRATRMPMIITDPRVADNPVVFANEAFCRLTGYDRTEIIGRNCRFLQGPDTNPDTVRRIREAVAAPRSIEIDIQNHRKDGVPFWNRLLMAPVFDTEGELAYFFASQVDVTIEQARLKGLENDNAALLVKLTGSEREKADQERELAFAITSAQFGTWSLDVATGRMTTSATCQRLFDRTMQELQTFQDRLAAIHPDDRLLSANAMEQSVRNGEDYSVEYRVIRRDGTVRWISSKAQPFVDASGAVTRLTGISSDITDQRRAGRMRDALIQLGDMYRDMEDPSDISFAAAEILGRTLEVSRAGYGTINREAEIVVIERDWNAPGIASLAGTLHFREYGSYIDDLKQGVTVLIEDARTDKRTSQNPSALEAIRARAFLNMPLHEQGGLVALLYLNHEHPRPWLPDEIDFVRDVAERTRLATERRRAEQELALLAESLESEVFDRTRELMVAEESLRQSQKMEAVGQLTGGLAHDFNNLLTGITGSLEMLQIRIAQGRIGDVDKYVNAAQGAARRAAGLTHRLLAFSRRQTLAPKPVDVRTLVSGMEELIQRTVGPAITMETVHASGLWATMVDPGQLENALLNLCINARDAMPGGGRLMIETANRWIDDHAAKERDMAAGQYISLCVSDTGTGMSPDVIAKAFDPFFTTKPIGMGTGLGLSMIYGFARQSGGHVRIYSEVGEGTVICIYLPRHVGEVDVDVADDGRESIPGAPGHETVLVIDDDPTVRMFVKEVLEDLGYSTLEAADGKAGLMILNSGAKIDLLITDVGLPNGMNGRQVADAARQIRSDLKIMFITGYAENAVLSHGHLDPGMHVLTKPFTMDTIARRVRDLLGEPTAAVDRIKGI